MSIEITTAFVQQYKSNVIHLSQQKQSKLETCVRVEPGINAEFYYWERLGATDPSEKTTRHGDTKYVNSAHSRRRMAMTDYVWADLVDKEDKIRLLIDPQSEYAIAARNGYNRQKDRVIIAALGGNAYAGKNGETTVALPAGQKVAAGGANLTIAKWRSGLEILELADVDEDEETYIIISPKVLTALLNITEVKSADYNSVKALVNGDINTYLGCKVIKSNLLPANLTANGKLCYIWKRSGIGLGLPADFDVQIDRLPTKNQSVQVWAGMTVGATRVEDEKVVEIDCIGA